MQTHHLTWKPQQNEFVGPYSSEYPYDQHSSHPSTNPSAHLTQHHNTGITTQQNIMGFNVTMDILPRMHVFLTLSNIQKNRKKQRRRQMSDLLFAQLVTNQCIIWHVLSYNNRHSISAKAKPNNLITLSWRKSNNTCNSCSALSRACTTCALTRAGKNNFLRTTIRSH